jgi:hypothetical protein
MTSDLDPRTFPGDDWPIDEDEASTNGADPFRKYDLGAQLRKPGKRPAVLANLIYAGKTHSISGPPEAGKTILCLHLMMTAMALGRPVVLFDHETGPEQISDLLRSFGADPKLVDKLLTYVPFPATGWRDVDVTRMHDMVSAIQPAIVTFDSFGEMMAANGADENRAGDVVRFANRVFAPITRLATGNRRPPAVIITDHDAKPSASGAGDRYARGSTSKLAKLDVAIKLTPVRPFSRDNDGLVQLMISKDRLGCLHRHWEIAVTRFPLAMTFRKTSAPKGKSTGPVPPGPEGMPPAQRKLLDVVNNEPAGIKVLTDRVAEKYGHGFKRPTVSDAMNALLEAKLVDRLDGGPGREALWLLPGGSLEDVVGPAADWEPGSNFEAANEGVRKVSGDTPA